MGLATCLVAQKLELRYVTNKGESIQVRTSKLVQHFDFFIISLKLCPSRKKNWWKGLKVGGVNFLDSVEHERLK